MDSLNHREENILSIIIVIENLHKLKIQGFWDDKQYFYLNNPLLVEMRNYEFIVALLWDIFKN